MDDSVTIGMFAEVARSLAEQTGRRDTLRRIVDLATQTVPGAQYAAVSLVESRRKVATVTYTEDICCRVDEVQYETGQGPCLDAIFERDTVLINDLTGTGEWPEFADRAVALGVRSMLSFRLFVEGDTAGALNLYSLDTGAFSETSIATGGVFAAHAAVAWDHAKEVEGLQRAIATREVIGQAQGVLMSSRKITSDVAFDLLRTASQHRNVKLHTVAQEVVDTGTLPEAH